MFLCELGLCCVSPYRGAALHMLKFPVSCQNVIHVKIPVQILAGKFKMQLLPTISLTKAFPVAQICTNLHKIAPRLLETILSKFVQICVTGNAFVRLIVSRKMHLFLGSRSERGGASRALTKRATIRFR